jgi:RNA polymerase sigma factor (sigma-70 family)
MIEEEVHSDPEGTELIERAKTDNFVFEQLYNKYITELYRIVFRRVGHRETAEDIVSVAFTKAFTNLDTYTGNEKGFKAWLYRITTNTLIDHYRKQGSKQETPIEPVEHLLLSQKTADQATNDQFTRKNIDQALQKLPKQDQEIIHLKYFAEYSNTEIAEHLNISTNSCAVKLYRALRKLQSAYPTYDE